MRDLFKINIITLIFISLSQNIVKAIENNGLTDETILYNNLLNEYNSLARPVFNYKKVVDIYFKLKLIQINELSEKDQILKTSVWLEQVNQLRTINYNFFIL
jgi:hypothetical protein